MTTPFSHLVTKIWKYKHTKFFSYRYFNIGDRTNNYFFLVFNNKNEMWQKYAGTICKVDLTLISLDSVDWFLLCLFLAVYFIFFKRRSQWFVIIVIRLKAAKSLLYVVRKTYLMNGMIRVNAEIRRFFFFFSSCCSNSFAFE